MAAGDYLGSVKNAPFVPTLIANQVLGALGSYLSLGRTVTKDSELVTQQVGTTINVPKRGVVSSNSLAENGSVTLQQPASTTVPVVLTNHNEVTIGELSYAQSIQQGGSVLNGYVEDGVIALGEDIESALAALWSQFPVQQDAGGTNPQVDLIHARTALVRNKVPKLARKYAYVSPGFVDKLLQQAAFIDPKIIPSNNALEEGAVGRAGGFDVFEGQLVVRSGSPGVDRNMCYTRNAMVLATRPQPLPEAGLGAVGANVIDANGIALQVVKSYNANKLGNQISIHVVFGVAMLDDRQAVELDSSY
jgi:hypothetical protein